MNKVTIEHNEKGLTCFGDLPIGVLFTFKEPIDPGNVYMKIGYVEAILLTTGAKFQIKTTKTIYRIPSGSRVTLTVRDIDDHSRRYQEVG